MRHALDVGIRGATAHEYNREPHVARLAPGGEAAHRGGLPGSRMAGYDAYDFAVGGRRGSARIGGGGAPPRGGSYPSPGGQTPPPCVGPGAGPPGARGGGGPGAPRTRPPPWGGTIR